MPTTEISFPLGYEGTSPFYPGPADPQLGCKQIETPTQEYAQRIADGVRQGRGVKSGNPDAECHEEKG